MRKLLIIVLMAALLLSGCQSKLGGAERKPLSEADRAEFLDSLGGQGADTDIYNEAGIIINSSHRIEISSWKLNTLAQAYEQQNDTGYILSVEDLDSGGVYRLSHRVTTEDFRFDARLSGDESSMVLELELVDDCAVIIVPRGCILNGVLKDTMLFRGSEPSKGKFVISAQMSDFDALSIFGLSMESVSSIAWLLSAINTETQEMRDFLFAASFSTAQEWSGIQVSENFSADSGIIMWTTAINDAVYLCTFNGSEEKISSDITVAGEGSFISDIYTLEVSSGECAYMLLGYDVSNIKVFLQDMLIFTE